MLSDVSSLPPFEWEKAYALTKNILQKRNIDIRLFYTFIYFIIQVQIHYTRTNPPSNNFLIGNVGQTAKVYSVNSFTKLWCNVKELLHIWWHRILCSFINIMKLARLTLFCPVGGTLCPPYHVFAYICANTRTSALKKLDFSRLWVWKRAIHFLPHKVFSFRWKKIKFVGNTKIS